MHAVERAVLDAQPSFGGLRVTVAVWEGGVLCRPSRVRQPWRERSPSCKKHPGSYSDDTGYMPVNTVEAVIDPNR